MDKQQIKVLMIEDSADDELLIVRELKKGGFDPFVHRVWNGEGLQQALTKGEWDCILSDHQMPDFDVFRALKIVKETEKDIPFIIVSGAIGEEKAVEAMKAGAHDFIDKNRMSRLCVAIRREQKAVPGFSKHSNGTAIDLGTTEYNKTYGAKNDPGWMQTWLRKWMDAHAKKFGFEPLKSEPWHWNYVGNKRKE